MLRTTVLTALLFIAAGALPAWSIPNHTTGTLVCDATGSPLANCEVTVKFFDAYGYVTGATTTTDASGQFDMVLLCPNHTDPSHWEITSKCCGHKWTIPTNGCAGDLGTLHCTQCGTPYSGKCGDLNENLDTGYSQEDQKQLGPGHDDDWVLKEASGCPIALPQAATVVTQAPRHWAAPEDWSMWISSAPNGTANPACTGYFWYQRCFCLSEEGLADASLDIFVMSEGRADVAVNQNPIGSVATPGWNSPTHIQAGNEYFQAGENCIDVQVFADPGASTTGLNIVGSVSGTAGRCCDCANPPSDMVLWHPYDTIDTSVSPPTTEDIAGNSSGPHPGALHPAAGPVVVGGKVTGALSFDGVDDYVEVADDPALDFQNAVVVTGQNLSIDAWIKTEATSLQIIADKRLEESGSTTQGYSLYVSSGTLGFQLADGSVPGHTCSSSVSGPCTNYGCGGPNIADDNWHHVAVTVDRLNPAGGTCYIDGSPTLTFNPTFRTGDLSNAMPLRVGRRSDSSNGGFFRGKIDQLEVFRRVLNAAEVHAIYAAKENGKCTDGVLDHQVTTVCPQDWNATVSPKVCNHSGQTQNYQWSVIPVAGGTTQCPDQFHQWSFTPSSGTFSVPAWGCANASFSAALGPSAVNAGSLAFQKGCYQFLLTNLGTGQQVTGDGVIQRKSNSLYCSYVGDVDVYSDGSDISVDFAVFNETDSDGTAFIYTFSAEDAVSGAPSQIISLNGLPPGTPVSGTASVAAHSAINLSVSASATEHQEFRFQRIVLRADIDLDGTIDPDELAASGVRTLRTAPPPAVPRSVNALSVGRSDLRWLIPQGSRWYDLIRGDLGLLGGSAGNYAVATSECVADDADVPFVNYPHLPASGQGHWYLVRANNAAGAGTYDESGTGQLSPRDAEIGASPSACP